MKFKLIFARKEKKKIETENCYIGLKSSIEECLEYYKIYGNLEKISYTLKEK